MFYRNSGLSPNSYTERYGSYKDSMELFCQQHARIVNGNGNSKSYNELVEPKEKLPKLLGWK